MNLELSIRTFKSQKKARFLLGIRRIKLQSLAMELAPLNCSMSLFAGNRGDFRPPMENRNRNRKNHAISAHSVHVPEKGLVIFNPPFGLTNCPEGVYKLQPLPPLSAVALANQFERKADSRGEFAKKGFSLPKKNKEKSHLGGF